MLPALTASGQLEMQRKQAEQTRHVGGDGGSATEEGEQERGMEEGLQSGERKGRP